MASWPRLPADVTRQSEDPPPAELPQILPTRALPRTLQARTQSLHTHFRGAVRSAGLRLPGRQYPRGGRVRNTRRGKAKQRNIPEEWRAPKAGGRVRLTTSAAGRKPPPSAHGTARHLTNYGNPAKAQDRQPRRHGESRFSLQTPTVMEVSSLLLHTPHPVRNLLESLPPTS